MEKENLMKIVPIILPDVERVMLEHLTWRHDQLVRFLNDPNHNS